MLAVTPDPLTFRVAPVRLLPLMVTDGLVPTAPLEGVTDVSAGPLPNASAQYPPDPFTQFC